MVTSYFIDGDCGMEKEKLISLVIQAQESDQQALNDLFMEKAGLNNMKIQKILDQKSCMFAEDTKQPLLLKFPKTVFAKSICE